MVFVHCGSWNMNFFNLYVMDACVLLVTLRKANSYRHEFKFIFNSERMQAKVHTTANVHEWTEDSTF